jgi:hypothetical protein
MFGDDWFNVLIFWQSRKNRPYQVIGIILIFEFLKFRKCLCWHYFSNSLQPGIFDSLIVWQRSKQQCASFALILISEFCTIWVHIVILQCVGQWTGTWILDRCWHTCESICARAYMPMPTLTCTHTHAHTHTHTHTHTHAHANHEIVQRINYLELKTIIHIYIS